MVISYKTVLYINVVDFGCRLLRKEILQHIKQHIKAFDRKQLVLVYLYIFKTLSHRVSDLSVTRTHDFLVFGKMPKPSCSGTQQVV